jgi:DNA-binding NtrC family response regulator
MAMMYAKLLERDGFDVTIASTAAAGLAAIDEKRHDVLVLDLMLPDGSGLDLLEHAGKATPDVFSVVMTADGSINRAVEAMRLGAFDFMVKPFSETAFVASASNAVTARKTALKGGGTTKGAKTKGSTDYNGFVGDSEPMKAVYSRIEQVGRSTATVFITGESGTGKEVCAQAIHRVSNRAKAPFIALNCGAIPSELLESEVFGHLKGSFSGAISDQLGAARAADGGTLFLDELCEMDLSLQTKLLRFLQTSTVTPVGATRPVPVDVRIICATNRNPAMEVRAKRLREDLFFRLYVVPIHLPPLRERSGDVMTLARHFLTKFAREEGKEMAGFDALATERLTGMRWPGNVRQLENLMRMIAAVHDGPLVTADMLPSEVDTSAIETAQPGQPGSNADPAGTSTDADRDAPLSQRIGALVGEELGVVERALIEETIAACGGSIPKASRMLGVSPSTIYRRREAWEAERGVA